MPENTDKSPEASEPRISRRRYTLTEKWTSEPFCSLSPAAKLIFLWMKDRCDAAGFLKLGISWMTSELGLSEKAIYKHNKELFEQSDLVIFHADTRTAWMPDFIIEQGCEFLNKDNNAHKGIIRCIEFRRPDFTGIPQFDDFLEDYPEIFFPDRINNEKSSSNTPPKKKPQNSPKATPKTEYHRYPGFLQFWSIYPNKQGKVVAFRKWKSKRFELIASRIILAVEYFKKTREWLDGYIPHASTFVNQEKWEDLDDDLLQTPSQQGLPFAPQEPDEAFIKAVIKKEFPDSPRLKGDGWKKWRDYPSVRLAVETAFKKQNG